MTITGSRGFPDGYLAPGSSFLDFAAQHAPTIMPGTQPTFDTIPQDIAPHGTTIVALEYHNGIIIAGDRRATMGTTIAHREIEKVFAADEHSAIAIAGTAGLAIELVRLFQLELEHYEKIEGTPLSLDGKANRLSTMLRSHLHLALQGLPIVPIFAGWDSTRHQGRLFAYDVTGGRYEEPNFTCAGSGSVFARSALKNSGNHNSTQHAPSPSHSKRSGTQPTTTPPPQAPTSSDASGQSSQSSTTKDSDTSPKQTSPTQTTPSHTSARRITNMCGSLNLVVMGQETAFLRKVPRLSSLRVTSHEHAVLYFA